MFSRWFLIISLKKYLNFKEQPLQGLLYKGYFIMGISEL
jgi:hypothetical protein